MNVRGEAPARLFQEATAGIDESLALHERWNGAGGGRLRAALAPRFAISCTTDLLEATAAVSRSHGLLVHTHASEQREEIEVVRAQTGRDNLDYLSSVGLASNRLCVAHCVWVTDREQALLAELRQRLPLVDEAAGLQNYRSALANLSELGPAVDRFFTDVLVMTDDRQLRTARLSLMAHLRNAVLRIGDVSEVVAADK